MCERVSVCVYNLYHNGRYAWCACVSMMIMHVWCVCVCVCGCVSVCVCIATLIGVVAVCTTHHLLFGIRNTINVHVHALMYNVYYVMYMLHVGVPHTMTIIEDLNLQGCVRIKTL